MPPEVLKRFQKLELDFFWEYKKHTVNEETLYLPRDQGGAGILDLEARNEAIYLVWAREYMKPPAERPTWAFVADEIFRHSLTLDWQKKVRKDKHILTNFILQSWKHIERVRRTERDDIQANEEAAGLPLELDMMYKTAKKYQISIEAQYVSEEARTRASAWYSAEHDTTYNQHHSGAAVECLRKKHRVVTIQDAMDCYGRDDDPAHQENSDCECPLCEGQRAIGCENPHRCQVLALDLVITQREKWRPGWGNPDKSNYLGPDETAANEQAALYGLPVTFDASVPEPPRPEQYARVFTKELSFFPDGPLPTNGLPPGTHEVEPSDSPEVTVMCCGAVRAARSVRARATYAVQCQELGITLARALGADNPQTRERAATMAIWEAAKRAPKDQPLLIKTNATRTVTRLTNAKRKLEQTGWVLCGDDADIYRATAAMLRSRSARTRLQYICEEDNDAGTAATCAMARDALEENPQRAPFITAPASFDAPGMPLENIMQKLATRVIRKAKAIRTPQRTAAIRNLERTRNDMAPMLKFRLPDAKIWRGTQHRDFSKEARTFMWRTGQDAHRCGPYLENWGGEWVEKSKCKACIQRPTESIEHILLHCAVANVSQIWALAKELWSRTKRPWPTLTIGTIIGCGTARFMDLVVTDREAIGISRLYRIIISESALLIWKLRCKRVIGHEDDPDWRHPPAYVESEWYRIINDRLSTDRLLTNRRIYGKKALKKTLVLETWSRVLDLREIPEVDWTTSPGVLVGKRA